MALAIFDLDNTLLGGDSDYAWGEYLVATGKVDAESYAAQNDYFFEQYKLGKLDIHAFQALALGPLAGQSADTLARWHREFMDSHIKPLRLPKADDLVEQHRRQGDRLLIITATNRFITGPIASWLGIEELIATEAEMMNGDYTGQMTGTPCYQEGKVERLNAWLAIHNETLAGSTFYSDSRNDLPLLELVTRQKAAFRYSVSAMAGCTG
jgi:HAD superfamily hydrolase (TIGR01490 family)